MKKILLSVFVLSLAFILVSCGDEGNFNTHEEYFNAAVDTELVVRAYVQGKQSWWDNKAVIYAQDNDGGYLFYNLSCTQEEYDNDLKIGQYIEVSGKRAEYKGEAEIGEGCTFKKLKGNKTYKAFNATSLFGNDTELIKHQNEFVSFKGLEVVAKHNETTGEDVGFFYSWDGSGEAGSDIYFDVTDGKSTVTFTIESYLCDADSDAYKAAEALVPGSKYDFEGFAYWYEGLNMHITNITAK